MKANTIDALRYCLSYPGISTVIPGMMTAAEVEENVKASELGPLPPKRVKEIERIYDDNEFFVGR